MGSGATLPPILLHSPNPLLLGTSIVCSNRRGAHPPCPLRRHLCFFLVVFLVPVVFAWTSSTPKDPPAPTPTPPPPPLPGWQCSPLVSCYVSSFHPFPIPLCPRCPLRLWQGPCKPRPLCLPPPRGWLLRSYRSIVLRGQFLVSVVPVNNHRHPRWELIPTDSRDNRRGRRCHSWPSAAGRQSVVNVPLLCRTSKLAILGVWRLRM